MPDHRADAGGDAAADDGSVRPGQILAHRDDLLSRTDDVFGKRADARHLVDGLAVKLHARGAVVHTPARGVIVAAAEHGAPARTVAAVAAVRTEGEDDMIIPLDIADAGTELHDDPRGLMAQDHWQG